MSVPRHIDQQVSEEAIHQPERTLPGGQLRECDLKFVKGIVPRFVYARVLARRPDERAREQERKRGMVLPERDHTPQQVGSPQQWTVRSGSASKDNMITAACSSMAAIVCEFFRCQPGALSFV